MCHLINLKKCSKGERQEGCSLRKGRQVVSVYIIMSVSDFSDFSLIKSQEGENLQQHQTCEGLERWIEVLPSDTTVAAAMRARVDG